MAMHYALIALARGRNEAVPWSLVSQAIKKVPSVAIQDCNLRERRVFITVKLNVQASRAACASASGLGTRDCVGREQVKQSSTVIVERSSNQQVSCRIDMTSRLA
jgi:hypothetical protein